MGLRLIRQVALTLALFLQCCPIASAQPAVAPAPEQQEDEPPARRARIERIANVLFAAGVAFTALELGHQREVCSPAGCASERRRGYQWGALTTYAAATVGYVWILADKRTSIAVSPRGVTTRFAW